MKKIIHISVLCALACFPACDLKEDYSSIGSVDSRIAAQLSEYETLLCSAPYGWLADVATGRGGTHRLWMGFADNGEVTMYTDYVEYYRALRTLPYTSTYAVKAQQRPTLSFDTYSYLSIFADPDPLANGAGETGIGMIADFEYEILSYDKGQFLLQGLKHGMSGTLTEATLEEYQAVQAGALMDCIDGSPIYEPQFLTFNYGGKSYELSSNGRRTAICRLERREPYSAIVNSRIDFAGNLILETPLTLGDQQITRFDKTATGYSAVIGNELVDIVRSTSTPASYMGLRNTDLSNVFYSFPSNAQTEWNSEFYAIVQQMMTNLYRDPEMPLYVSYIGVQFYTNPVAWVEIGYYLVTSAGLDTSRVYSSVYQYPLTMNPDGSYTFGDSYTNVYGEDHIVSNIVKGHSTCLLDGFFKGRTFYCKAWPRAEYNGNYPFVALVPTQGVEETGAMVGFMMVQN